MPEQDNGLSFKLNRLSADLIQIYGQVSGNAHLVRVPGGNGYQIDVIYIDGRKHHKVSTNTPVFISHNLPEDQVLERVRERVLKIIEQGRKAND